MIRVIDGPFNDFSGVIEEVDSEKGKVKVEIWKEKNAESK